MTQAPVAETAHLPGSVVDVVVVVGAVVVVVGTVVVVVGVTSGMVVTASVVVVVVVSVVDVVLLVVVDVVLDVVVVVVDVVVVAGVQVHSFGWPGGTHMPGHARSPLGAVTSHCSPWSSLPLPHGNSSMAMSVRRLSATRWPMTTALPPIRSFASGANN